MSKKFLRSLYLTTLFVGIPHMCGALIINNTTPYEGIAHFIFHAEGVGWLHSSDTVTIRSNRKTQGDALLGVSSQTLFKNNTMDSAKLYIWFSDNKHAAWCTQELPGANQIKAIESKTITITDTHNYQLGCTIQ